MRAARLRIEIDPPNLWPLQLHQERFYRRNGARRLAAPQGFEAIDNKGYALVFR
jgi:hypothetical protein